jgi:predicted nucleic acid-binding protein
MLAVVDAGPLYATADADDQDHEACRAVRSRGDLRLVVPALVVAEATYFVGGRLGARAEAAFLRDRESLDVEGPGSNHAIAKPSNCSRSRESAVSRTRRRRLDALRRF